MFETDIALPSKPRVVLEEGNNGVYEIDGLYAGYGHTLGNSLRRIILSSLPGVAITTVKIDGVPHEFSTMEGIAEDVVTILLNLKRVHFRLHGEGDEPQMVTISAKGAKEVTAKDIKAGSQVEVLNPEQHIATISEKGKEFKAEISIERGMGYAPKETWKKGKVDIGAIALDATFTPIRRANYEVELMRVEERTDYNRLRITIETDGSLSPREALEYSIDTMIKQLKAIRGIEEEDAEEEEVEGFEKEEGDEDKESDTDILKTRIETLDLSARTANALESANVRTIGGLVRKSEEDLLDIEGLGAKGIQEIKRALSNYGETLK